MLENGYIKVYRRLKKWGWYTDVPVKTLWLHLLLSANYEEGMFLGRQVQRGQLVTSYASLAEGSGLSVQQVRTALAKLRKTGEITVQTNRHHTVITIPKFDEYQQTVYVPAAGTWQTGDTPAANRQQTGHRPAAARKEEQKNKHASRQAGEKEWRVPLTPTETERFSEKMLGFVRDWLTYKHEKGEDYKPTGLKSLLTEIENRVSTVGEDAVCEVIRLSMSNGWRGIIWDRLPKSTAAQPQTGAPLADWERDWLKEVELRKAK